MEHKKDFPEFLIKEFFLRAWKAPYDYSVIDELMTEDFEMNSAGKIIRGKDHFKSWIINFHRLLRNAENEILDVFSGETQRKVVARWKCSGENNGIFNLPADQEQISFSGIAIWAVKNNKLSHCWVERSALEVYLTYK